MNSTAMPIVEKIAPKPVPDQCRFWNQYAPIVSSQDPQMKNWRKFMTIRRSFRLTVQLPEAGALERRRCVRSVDDRREIRQGAFRMRAHAGRRSTLHVIGH